MKKKILQSVAVLIIILVGGFWGSQKVYAAGWKNVGDGPFSPGEANNISLVINPKDGEPYVAYTDYSDDPATSTVKRFHNNSWRKVGSAKFGTGASPVSLAFNSTGGILYVAYGDDYEPGVRVKKYESESWHNVGDKIYRNGGINDTSLALSSSGKPYIAFTDYAHSQKATVMKYDNGSWRVVGDEGFSNDIPWDKSLAFNPYNDNPYLAYTDWSSKKATVKEYRDGEWRSVGNAGISEGEGWSVSLAFDPRDGVPYVSYVDSNGEITVKKFSNGSWQTVGIQGFVRGNPMSLAFSPYTGEPYVAYANWSNADGKASVSKFSRGIWRTAGNVGFSAGSAHGSISLAFSPIANEAYVAYPDFGESRKAVVMKYKDESSVSSVNEAANQSNKSAPSSSKTTPTISDPVNSVFGNYLHQMQDIKIPNRGSQIVFDRTYNSQSKEDGLLGHKWTCVYCTRINLFSDGAVFVDTDGRWDLFNMNEEGAYIPDDGVKNSLKKNNDNTFTLTKKDLTEYRFDQNGKLISIGDNNGNSTTVFYDSDGNISEVAGSGGRSVQAATDNEGRITALTDPMGRVFNYEYDGNGDLISVTNPFGGKTKYTYDENNNMISITDPNDHIVASNEYDQENRVISQTDGRGNVGTFEYDLSQKATTFTDAMGHATKYIYDDRNRVVRHIDALGKEALSVFDDNDQLISSTDKNGNVTNFEYDSKSNLVEITDALGNIKTISYNDMHQPVLITDPRGNKTILAYDDKGNLLKITNALNGQSIFQYDEHGQLASEQNPEGSETTYSRTQYGDLETITDALGNVTRYSHNALGRVQSVIDATGREVRMEYDSLGRYIKMIDPEGNETHANYDGLDNVIQITDAKGIKTFYDYDEDNNLVRVTDGLGGKTSYEYDVLNRLVGITDANGNKSSYGHDALGRITEVTDAIGNKESHMFDNQGNMIKLTNGEGNSMTYEYDSLYRLKNKIYPDGSNTVFGYDKSSNLIEAENKNVAYAFVHDALNNITDFTDSRLGTLHYSYNKIGQKISVTDSENLGNSYQYDKNGRLSQISQNEGGEYSFSYDASGMRTRLSFPNGMSTLYEYNDAGRIKEILTTNDKKRKIASRSYSYDELGNRTKLENERWSINYNYDALSQLVRTGISRSSSKTEPGDDTIPKKEFSFPLEKYEYDAVGNRTRGSNTEKYEYNVANELMNIFSQNPSKKTTIDYDRSGNVVHETDKKGVWKFDHDAENRMVGAELSEMGGKKTRSVQYEYDPFGRRIAKRVQNFSDQGFSFWPFRNSKNTQIEQYFYDGEDIFSVYDGSENITSHFVHGLGVDEPLSVTNYEKNGRGRKKNSDYYYLADALGSITGLVDDKGKMTERYYYDSFGQLIFPGSRINQPYAFTGREYDSETGLYYHRARYYDPEIGRFLSKDPIAGFKSLPQSLNRYIYANNNPVRMVDRYGLSTQDSLPTVLGVSTTGSGGEDSWWDYIESFGKKILLGGGAKIDEGAEQLEADSRRDADACIEQGICKEPGPGYSYPSPLSNAWFGEDSGLRKMEEGAVDLSKKQWEVAPS